MSIRQFFSTLNKYYQLIISWILQPIFIPTYGMLLLMQISYYQMFPIRYKLVVVLGTLVLTGILPALSVLIMMRRGQISDVFIFYKEERTIPYLYSTAAYIFWTLFLWRTLQMPLFVVAMGVGSTCALLLILVVNWRWKISAHMTSMGGLVGGVCAVCYQTATNPLWLLISVLVLSGMLMISRISLNAHTPAQTVVGFLLGLFSTTLPGFLF